MEAAAQTILSLLLCPAAFSFLIFQPQPASENTLALLTRSSGKRIAFLRPLFLFPSGSPPFSAVTVRLELRAVHAAVDDGCDAPSSLHFPCPEYLSCRLAERTNKETNKQRDHSGSRFQFRQGKGNQKGRPSPTSLPACALHGCPAS